MKLKILELFAGIGAASKALSRLGIEHEIVDAVEIDKYAIKSFNAIHGTNFETQDITTWDKDIKVDLIMHGSPCQDFSVAGKQAGGDFGSGTRSSLMYETIRIVGKLRPKYVVWENVKNILSKSHKHNFDRYLETLETLGYKNYYQVLNAKDYGVPQNRERVFTISILGDENFIFPEKQELNLRLKDVLEEVVDEKYYLSDKTIKTMMKYNENYNPCGLSPTLTTELAHSTGKNLSPKLVKEIEYAEKLKAKEPKCIQVAQMYGTEKEPNPQAGRVYDANGISPTMDSCSGGNRMPKVIEYNGKEVELPAICASRGRNPENPSDRTPGNYVEQRIEVNTQGTSNTLTSVQKDNYVLEGNTIRIRKLTPKECFRLMGFDDEDFEKAAQVNSNSQLYKQAGNSIVVNVLEAIFKNLLNLS